MKSDILILLNKDKPGLSETFIKNHIDYFQAPFYNIEDFKPIKLFVFPLFINRMIDKISRKYRIYKFGLIAKKHKAKIILAEYGTTGAYAYEICKKNKLKLIVHFHGQDAHRESVLTMFGNAYKPMFLYASAIIVVSSKMKESLINLGCDADKIHLNGYGVDIEKFKFQNTTSSTQQLFSIGRFVDKKAPYLLILTFQKVLTKIPEARLVIAGNGNLFEACNRIIDALHLKENITLLKSIPHEKVADYMQQSSIYVQHSVVAYDGDSEGLPNTILEAAAMGLPIVSTKHAGIADFIEHGSNGYLVEENDIDAMANYIIEILKNPKKGKEMAQNARVKIEKNYNLPHTLKNLADIIQQTSVLN